MAHYCIKPNKSDDCQYRYRGTQIGTTRVLCNIFSEYKPCEDNVVKDNFISRLFLSFKNWWAKK